MHMVYVRVKHSQTIYYNTHELEEFSFFSPSFWCKSPPSSFQRVAATGMCPRSISPAVAKRQQHVEESYKLTSPVLTILLSQHAALLAGTLLDKIACR